MSFREQLLRELPRLLREDPVLRQAVLELVRPYFAERQVTEDRFERMFEELRHMREESERHWQQQLEEWERRWQQHQEEWRQWREESERRWQQQLEESERRWQQHREESERRWQQQLEESERRWQQHREESERRWQEHRKEWQQWREESKRRWQQHQEEIRREFKRLHFILGAIGARWGQRSEAAFRNAAIGLLREYLTDVKVQRLQIHDEEGVVFDHPTVIEIDLFVHNGRWILGEIKTAVDREDVYFFVKKARFAESHLGRKADKWIMISPFVTKRARKLLQEFGITLYTFREEEEELQETEQPPEEE